MTFSAFGPIIIAPATIIIAPATVGTDTITATAIISVPVQREMEERTFCVNEDSALRAGIFKASWPSPRPRNSGVILGSRSGLGRLVVVEEVAGVTIG
jgi:hypothetical protein